MSSSIDFDLKVLKGAAAMRESMPSRIETIVATRISIETCDLEEEPVVHRCGSFRRGTVDIFVIVQFRAAGKTYVQHPIKSRILMGIQILRPV